MELLQRIWDKLLHGERSVMLYIERFGKPTCTWGSRKLILVCVLVVMLVILTVSGIGAVAFSPVSIAPGKSVTISIKPGSPVKEIGEQLAVKGIVRSPLIFRVLVRLDNATSQLKAGEYQLSSAWTYSQIIEELKRGQKNYVTVTIPEGYTTKQIVDMLVEKRLGSRDKFVQALQRKYYDYITENSQQVTNPLEGFLFPDTYHIDFDMNEEQIITTLVKRFDESFNPEMRQQAQAKGMTVREIVTMASVIEREAKDDSERPLVASVFYNRIKISMPLQSCATVQYILGNPKAVLTVKDTEIDSPYNTYKHYGLPPGPIANPGLASLKAALNPAQTDYLYFLTRDDQNHVFSRSYEEHLAASR